MASRTDLMREHGGTADGWERSDAAFGFLVALVVAVTAWTWVAALPLARNGSVDAMGIIIESFGMNALVTAAIAVAYSKPVILGVAGVVMGIGLYILSLTLGDLVSGENVGLAIRVGAISVLSFAVAGWRPGVDGARSHEEDGHAHD